LLRREADKLIDEGRVTKQSSKLGTKVSPDGNYDEEAAFNEIMPTIDTN
jgi:hypothetical protein